MLLHSLRRTGQKKGEGMWDDRDGPKWPAPAKGKRRRAKWDDRDGPKWPAPAREIKKGGK